MRSPCNRACAGPQGASALHPKTRDHTRSSLAPHGERLRIRVYSDLHLEFAPFLSPPDDADVIVLAGDIDNGAAGVEWAGETFRRPVLYLAGNHEYYEGEFEAVQKAMGAAAREAAIELLDCSEAVLGGVRFLGCTLWTDYSLAPQEERSAVIESADRKSTRLNSSHLVISYAVFCLAK